MLLSSSNNSSPLIGKRRGDCQYSQDDDISLETSQLMIRSPIDNNKRPRYEATNWTLDNLCNHPCSPLADIDLESVFNMSTFHLLSQEKRDELCQLLPEVDQSMYYHHNNNSNSSSHTSGGNQLDHLNHEVNIPNHHYADNNSFVPNHPTFFASKNENPIFWNTLSDWQSMLGHNEYYNHPQPPLSPPTTTNNSSSNKSTSTTSTQQNIHNTKSRPSSAKSSSSSSSNSKKDKFKDEGFESYWGELIDKERAHNVAGDSKNITLKDMCRKGLIRENDVIVYKRNFSACKVVVSKSMTVVKASGLSGISIQLDDEVFEDFETPTALETKILDHHGKVTKDKRPNGNAFKSIRLIRSGKDMGRLFDIRKDGFSEPSSAAAAAATGY